ncbi:MAG TPA: hypothetical protein VFG77_01065 [Nitrososphaeraceae archaeon]|jgi:hypothetical protein|nr:hypothetical protein [Nitrososphaeraceae archaeon]
MKGNEKLTFALAIGVLSTLALSITLSPTFNLMVKAQGQNETTMSQGIQQELVELSEKVKDLASKAGLNVTIPQGGNLTEKLQALSDSDAFNNLSQQLSQQLSQLGINASNIQSLQQEPGSDFGDVIQKLQNLTSSRGA